MVKKLIDEYRVSVKRACRICLTARSLYYFKLQGLRDDRAAQTRIKEIAAARVRLRHRPHSRSFAAQRLAGQSPTNAAHLPRRRFKSAALPTALEISGSSSSRVSAIDFSE